MRSLWTILSVIAVANVLGLGAFIGWLHATDRIDLDRVRRLREVLTETVAEERARTEAESAEAAAAAEAERQRRADREPPLRTSDVLDVKLQRGEADRLREERRLREAQDLRRTLDRERGLLDQQRAELEADKAAFNAMRREIAELEGSEQFRRTLATYEALKPDAVRTIFLELLKPSAEGRPDEAGAAQVVAYLNAMQDRARAKIIDEFVRGEPALAAELLERLRTYGLEPGGPETPADGPSASVADGG